MNNVDPKRMEMLMKMMAAEEANRSMSSTDSVYITQCEPDAPGFYETSDQQRMDAYGNAMRQAQVAAENLNGMRGDYQIPQAYVSPNTTYIGEDGRVTTADSYSSINAAQ